MDEVRVFKALAHDSRLRILTLLSARQLCVCHLEAALGLPQAVVSQHLSVLRAAGLVESQRQGLWVNYRLAEPRGHLEEIIFAWLRSRLRSSKWLQDDLSRMRECVEKPLDEVVASVRR